ncbi:hypothetical protein FB567DRAFT_97526 [Paraphoma chrysanthemicola]|uniref:Heterokaryon incompatibility domain-containing protein n=1 Tax=Paraphoma chrysanthemicola TaxID=798071 RepID=A0A8K0VW11_9PLEO|nr:hypothetical protein FB567DRAFT_97526 [Paraphoma chrysanthemicola]
MARIYGLAQRVVVWLGEEKDDSTLALRQLEASALKAENPYTVTELSDDEDEDSHTRKRRVTDVYRTLDGPSGVRAGTQHSLHDREGWHRKRTNAISALLNRVYFRRVWVLQEMAAAHSLIFKCGDAEIPGHRVRQGLVAFNIHYLKGSLELQSRICPILSLLAHSFIRKRERGDQHLDLQPLVELIDTFHIHEACNPRDKIYAMLGMCSDHEAAAAPSPDYSISWPDLLENLARFVFGLENQIRIHCDPNLIFLQCTAYFVGTVTGIERQEYWDDSQTIQCDTTKSALEQILQVDPSRRPYRRFRLRRSKNAIQVNDTLLLSQATYKVLVVRSVRNYSRIAMVTDSTLTSYDWHPLYYVKDNIEGLPLQIATVTNLLWSWDQEITRGCDSVDVENYVTW